MKNLKFLLFFLIVFIFGCQYSCVSSTATSSNIRYIDNPQNVSNFTNSVVALVRRGLFGGTRPYCSAFFVDPRIIATAAHCLSQPGISPFDESVSGTVGQEVLFSTYEQWQNTLSNDIVPNNIANIIAINVNDDVALLQTREFISPNFLLINRTTISSVGSRVYSLSLPGGIPWVLSEGIISSLNFDDSNVLIEILASPPIFFGSSGGPLIDNNGRVIGITKSIAFRQSTFGVFTPIAKLLAIWPTNQNNSGHIVR